MHKSRIYRSHSVMTLSRAFAARIYRSYRIWNWNCSVCISVSSSSYQSSVRKMKDAADIQYVEPRFPGMSVILRGQRMWTLRNWESLAQFFLFTRDQHQEISHAWSVICYFVVFPPLFFLFLPTHLICLILSSFQSLLLLLFFSSFHILPVDFYCYNNKGRQWRVQTAVWGGGVDKVKGERAARV